MSRSGIVVLAHVGLVLLAVIALLVLLGRPVELGRQPLELRATLGALPALLLVAGMRPLLPWFSGRLPLYLLLVGLPLLAISPWYYFSHLPAREGSGVSGAQLASSLITESTSNGIVEIGFAYPIYTPTLSLRNNELFTREVDIYLRVLDGNNEPILFRAVREQLPDARLSVEASVRGLLSDSAGYLFLPVALPPLSQVEGRVVFIISNLNDGSTFDQALGRSYPAEFQVRDAATGDLLQAFPMTRI